MLTVNSNNNTTRYLVGPLSIQSANTSQNIAAPQQRPIRSVQPVGSHTNTVSLSSQPPLPDVKGPFAQPHELQQMIPLFKKHPVDMNSTMSSAMIFSLVYEILQKSGLTSSHLKRTFGYLQNTKQLKSAELGKTKVEGDRAAAGSNLLWAIAGGGLACAATAGGYAWQSTHLAASQAMISVGQAANSVSTNLGRWIDTTFSIGGQHKADKAQTDKQHADYLANLFGSQTETFKEANSQVMQYVQELISQLRNMAANQHEVASTIARNIG